ncbi:hypothetical protein Rhe02_80000 [Rhizocola hellebori]|uniref:Uncharacterized protein n=1 Tax=Rhizocola hellebori TaxID=1392758 RepID=A0A8J3QFG4_9ACTN|nr:hypothetical protein [Rhizocola hellebori]GIH09933.1 hypothetical protein Rhe02_80000 [Rhizocola hellebori]
MNFDPVIVAMISAIQMLDQATEEEAAPSFAVEVQQVMGDYLDELSGDDAREFREILLRIADERSSGDPLISQYLRRLADGLGVFAGGEGEG